MQTHFKHSSQNLIRLHKKLPRKSLKKKLIIAIDGPAGSGKSSTARALAMRIHLPYIDTGAMYRSLTLLAMQSKIPFDQANKIVKLAKNMNIRFGPMKKNGQKVYLNNKDVTKAIRTPELTKNVFYVAQEPLIRRQMVRLQRKMGKEAGAVMEGRDIGSVVFPNADYKFYFDAKPELRAKRRYKELLAEGKKVPMKQVLKEILERDAHDKNRKEGALKLVKGSRVLDTTELTIDATIDRILQILGGA